MHIYVYICVCIWAKINCGHDDIYDVFPVPEATRAPRKSKIYVFQSGRYTYTYIFNIYTGDLHAHAMQVCMGIFVGGHVYELTVHPFMCPSSLILSIADPETRWKGSAINDSPDTPFQRASAVHSTIARGVCGEPIYSRSSTHFGRMGTTRVGCKEPVNEGFNVGVPRLPTSPHP